MRIAHLGLDAIYRAARAIRGLALRRDTYDDERYFPPRDMDPEAQLAYFTAMVAIDHRTGGPLGRPFEAVVGGEAYRGADLLYRLGRMALEEDPGLFSPGRLASMGLDEGRRLMSFGGAHVWDLETRVGLLRDLGRRALDHGSFTAMLDVATVDEFVARLSEARAYEDPVRKKAMLLLKFLTGRGILKVEGEVHIPVDNHLTRIALRLGLVEVQGDVWGRETSRDEDIAIRTAVRDAWGLAARAAGVDPFALDDYLWAFGRSTCVRDSPKCGQCPFRDICPAHRAGHYPNEHTHTLTWYY